MGEVKKHEEKKIKLPDPTEEFTEFYSAAISTDENQTQERLTIDDVAAELKEIQVIEKRSDLEQKGEGIAIEMVDKSSGENSAK